MAEEQKKRYVLVVEQKGATLVLSVAQDVTLDVGSRLARAGLEVRVDELERLETRDAEFSAVAGSPRRAYRARIAPTYLGDTFEVL